MEETKSFRSGFVNIIGRPNVGKSTLLNALLNEEKAIVSDIAGTTRDVLHEHLSLRGIPLRIKDTAGLRDSDNPVEREGIRRAWEAIDKSDVIILLVDASQGITDADREILARLPGERVLRIYSKADLLDDSAQRDDAWLYLSVRNGEGMELLIDRITGQASDYNQDDQTIMARRRHVDALMRARDQVACAAEILHHSRSGELVAEELRAAQQSLNEITGELSSASSVSANNRERGRLKQWRVAQRVRAIRHWFRCVAQAGGDTLPGS